MTPDPTRFILIDTSHAGNVGAAARAMKVMGFDDLVLVAPRWADVLQREEASRWPAARPTCWQRARIVATLAEALDGVTYAVRHGDDAARLRPAHRTRRASTSPTLAAARRTASPSCSAPSASA